MTLAPGTRLGPYEVLGPIGAGGMGEVYRARDERLSREVAIKVLPASLAGDADRLRRFELEARATGQLNHPNIVAVHDTGTHAGSPYVVEELLEGSTLRVRMGGAALPPRKAIEYARQIAEGLAAAHQKGIIHRDLKPENVFVTADGRVKILDFGLAKLMAPEGDVAGVTGLPTRPETGAGAVVGTIGYMSPEQVRGHPADHRSDIFSLGAILYEMLTGRRPFQAGSAVETLNAILTMEPPPVSQVSQEVPAGLERLVQHCMEKSAGERFQSARDLAFQLEELSSPSALTVTPRPGGRIATTGRRLGIPLAIVLGLLVAAGAFLAGRQSRPHVETASYRELTFRQGSIGSARFTPDGQTVVYSAAWEGAPTEMFSTRPGSPESRGMEMPSATILSISPAGEMALLLNAGFTFGFMRSGTLARAPLAGGVPRHVLEEVEDADWSPGGDGLAVARSSGGRYRLEYPAGKVLYETEAWIGSPRFSRDGRRIGFVDHPQIGDSRGRIAVVDLAGRMTVLTETYSSAGGLAWSPGGGEIWYTAGTTGNVQALHGVDLAGRVRVVDGAPANLTLHDVSSSGSVLMTRDVWRRGIVAMAPGASQEKDLTWLDWSRLGALSADGQWILFDEQGQGGGPEYSIYLRRTDGSPAVRLGSGLSCDLSPDGRWALTLALDPRDRVVLVPTGAGESRTIMTPGLALSWAGWFPDGQRLLLHGAEPGELRRYHVLDREGAAPRPITPHDMAGGVAFSPDGRFIAAAVRGAAPALYPVEPGEPRPIPAARPGDAVVAWSGDGRSIFVLVRTGTRARIDVLDPEGDRRSTWKELNPPNDAGLVDVGIARVSRDGGTYAYSYRRLLSTLYMAEGLR